LGFPQVEHLFKTGGLCIMSRDFQSLGSSYPELTLI
jgi:hypothetical protein